MSAHFDPRQNQVLGALPGQHYERIEGHVEPIPLPFGWPVYESGMPITYLYFPTEGVVSILQVMETRASGEIAVVGNQGVIHYARGNITIMDRECLEARACECYAEIG